MIIAETHFPDVCCIELYGCLDAGSAPEVLQVILHRVEQGQSRILLDLARLDYASSAGLRVFLMASRRMNQQDGQIVLVALNRNVRKLFDIAGLSLLFEIRPTREEALKQFGVAVEDLNRQPGTLTRIGEDEPSGIESSSDDFEPALPNHLEGAIRKPDGSRERHPLADRASGFEAILNRNPSNRLANPGSTGSVAPSTLPDRDGPAT